MSPNAAAENRVPPVAGWFQDGFHRFLWRYLKRNFHTIAIARDFRPEQRIADDEPLIVYGNHPSWWDPLMAHYLNRTLFPERQFYAPIDAAALEQYKVFAKLGFYGVKMDSGSGAADFLKTSSAILNAGDTAIWMTPEGQFTDARDYSVPLMPGLAHLCNKMDRGVVVPLALEYVFWEERLPECLSLFGDPIPIAEYQSLSKPEWSEKLDAALRQSQAKLSELAIARSSQPFDNLLSGTSGAGFFYDTFRRAKSLVTGKKFQRSHGDQFE